MHVCICLSYRQCQCHTLGDIDALALTTSDPDAVNVQLAELEAVLEDALLSLALRDDDDDNDGDRERLLVGVVVGVGDHEGPHGAAQSHHWW